MLPARPLRYNGRRETAGAPTQLGVFREVPRPCQREPAPVRSEEAAGRLSREAPAEDSNPIAGRSDSPAASSNLGLSEILPEPVEDLGAILCGRTSDRPLMVEQNRSAVAPFEENLSIVDQLRLQIQSGVPFRGTSRKEALWERCAIGWRRS